MKTVKLEKITVIMRDMLTKKIFLFTTFLLYVNVCFSHTLGDYHFLGIEKFMRCEGELGVTYLKLEKKWFKSARVFQKEDGIWNELCLEDEQQGRNIKKNLTMNGGKCEYEELSEQKGKRFYGFIFDFEFGEFEFYTFDLSPNYDSNFTESVVYACDEIEPF